ncbi:MAG: hypothetical protein RRY06_09820 [Lachnospiraceae bacterium]
MSFSYANPGSGPSAGGIGWFNFNNFTLNPGQTTTGLTGTLNDGTTVTFDISAPSSSSMVFDAYQPPASSYFGYVGYTGMLGNTILQNRRIGSYDPAQFTISNIVVKDPFGNPVTNYTTIVADAEDTNIGEQWTFNTDGGPWNLFTTIGSNPTTLTGLGTQTANIIGTTQLFTASYLLSTQSPKTLNFTTVSNGGLEAIGIGFAVTKVSVCKNIGDRIHSSDQFIMNIAGTPNDQIITTGSADGMQSPCAVVYGNSGSTYTINEQMAPGSVSLLSAYKQTVSAVNISPGGTIPPTGSLPINFTPALGDIVQYTILNSAPELFKKSVDKAFAKPGDILTYTVTGINPNNYPLPGVVFTDPTPAGTTYIGNLIVSVPYTGTTPATGLTLTMPANSTVTASYQVQVSPNTPVNNPIVNIASANVPGGTSGSTNPVSTQINYADLTSSGNVVKSAVPAFAQFGDTLTYTVTLKNTGNVAANQVVVTDIIPAGTSYIPGSTTASVPFTGDPSTVVTFTAPIPAGGTASITFKVKLSNSTPPVNPVPNTANVNYAYTVNPAQPNDTTATGISNTVKTPVSTAQLQVVKSTDKSIAYIGDIITYHLVITNTGNVSGDQVVITDTIPNGTVLVPGSLIVSVPYTGGPASSIVLTNTIPAGQIVTITFQVKVTAMPNPNPIENIAHTSYAYTVNPTNVNGVTRNTTSNPASTIVFTNNYRQQISDLIESVALEETAVGAIANAEGAKIQHITAMPNVTANQLLCLNESVTNTTNAMALLESILMQKLNTVNCQIDGSPKC